MDKKGTDYSSITIEIFNNNLLHQCILLREDNVIFILLSTKKRMDFQKSRQQLKEHHIIYNLLLKIMGLSLVSGIHEDIST